MADTAATDLYPLVHQFLVAQVRPRAAACRSARAQRTNRRAARSSHPQGKKDAAKALVKELGSKPIAPAMELTELWVKLQPVVAGLVAGAKRKGENGESSAGAQARARPPQACVRYVASRGCPAAGCTSPLPRSVLRRLRGACSQEGQGRGVG